VQPVVALRQHEAQRTVGFDLQIQPSFELQSRREQGAGRHGLAEQAPHRGRIDAARLRFLPGGFQAHPLPADREILEQEAVQTVAVTHFSHPACGAGAR
jgi:hypothetical protein